MKEVIRGFCIDWYLDGVEWLMVVIGEAFMMRNGTQMKVFDTNLSPDSNGAFKINLINIIVAHFLLFVSFILYVASVSVLHDPLLGGCRISCCNKLKILLCYIFVGDIATQRGSIEQNSQIKYVTQLKLIINGSSCPRPGSSLLHSVINSAPGQ